VRVFVTGGTGHSGSYLIPELVAAGTRSPAWPGRTRPRSPTASSTSRTGSIGSPGNPGRPATEDDSALPGGGEYQGTLRVRNIVETTVIGLAGQGVRSSVALAKEKGVVGYPGDGANLWNAVHIRDVASLFRLALEKGLPAVSIPADVLMVPGYFGFLANMVTRNTRRTLGWEPAQPGLLADLDNGHYFPRKGQ